MKLAVSLDRAGNVESVAILGEELQGLHMEVEGSLTREIEVDERTVERAALTGQKGAEEQKAAFEKLRRLL